MLAVVRIRGNVGIRKEFKDTLKMLKLDSVNSCIVIQETDSYRGMIKKVKDLVTFGEIDLETFTEILKKRGRLNGNKRLNEAELKHIGYGSVEKLAEDIFKGKTSFKEIESLKPVFKLTPPSGGFKATRTHYPNGDLGYRGKEIEKLIKKMI